MIFVNDMNSVSVFFWFSDPKIAELDTCRIGRTGSMYESSWSSCFAISQHEPRFPTSTSTTIVETHTNPTHHQNSLGVLIRTNSDLKMFRLPHRFLARQLLHLPSPQGLSPCFFSSSSTNIHHSSRFARSFSATQLPGHIFFISVSCSPHFFP
jgi:hypothetical protein